MNNKLFFIFLIPIFIYSEVIFEDDFEGEAQKWSSHLTGNNSVVIPKIINELNETYFALSLMPTSEKFKGHDAIGLSVHGIDSSGN